MRTALKLLTLILFLTTAQLTVGQNYVLHSATKGVKIESGKKTVRAVIGMSLKATDNIIIPKEGSASVLNKSDKRIYTSVRPGKLSVTKLMIEARNSATDKISGLTKKINIGRKGGTSGKRVHEEKGMVNRNCDVYTGDSIQPGPTVPMVPEDSIDCKEYIQPSVCPENNQELENEFTPQENIPSVSPAENEKESSTDCKNTAFTTRFSFLFTYRKDTLI